MPHVRAPFAAPLVLAITLLAGCGGGDPLPAAGPDDVPRFPATPTPSATPGALRSLALSGVTVVPPYDLVVDQRASEDGAVYEVRIDALNWDVAFDLETWRVAGPVVGAPLTSDPDAPGGGLRLRRLVVNGSTLGTRPADGACDDGDDDRRRREESGQVTGRFTRLDTVAVGRFVVSGTDDDCRPSEGTIELSVPIT